MASIGDSRNSALRLRNRSLLRLVIPTRRDTDDADRQPKDSQQLSAAPVAGTLTPDIQAGRRAEPVQTTTQHVECVDSEFLVYHEPTPGCALRAFDLQRRCMCLCRLLPMSQQASLDVFTAGLLADRLVLPRRVKLHAGKLYAFFDVHYGDLHGYIRERQRLRECEARRLFRQAALALADAHRHGIVLRDLKLRKLVFRDAQRTSLLLDGVSDGVLLPNSLEDQLAGPHQCCPAYLSPEVLDNARTGLTYSGRASDCWALGVILFTMVTGRYPFWSAEPVALFERISAAQYCVPDHCSPAVRSLIAGLLRRDQAQRLTADQVLQHPWLNSCADHAGLSCAPRTPHCVCNPPAAAAAADAPWLLAPADDRPARRLPGSTTDAPSSTAFSSLAEFMRLRAANTAEADSATTSGSRLPAGANADAAANATREGANPNASANAPFYGVVPGARTGEAPSQSQASSTTLLSFVDGRPDRHRLRHRARAERGPYWPEYARRVRLAHARLPSADQAVPGASHC